MRVPEVSTGFGLSSWVRSEAGLEKGSLGRGLLAGPGEAGQSAGPWGLGLVQAPLRPWGAHLARGRLSWPPSPALMQFLRVWL